MTKGRAVWAGFLILFAVLEGYGISNPASDDTLSEFTRTAFSTDTPLGMWSFIVGWVGFAAWFLVHIVTGHNARAVRPSPPIDD